MRGLYEQVFSIRSEEAFHELALATFNAQYLHNPVYGGFVRNLGVNPALVRSVKDIPFLPVSFFKTKDVVCGAIAGNAVVFTSSSTTGQVPSRHIVNDRVLYEKSFSNAFELFYGKPEAYVILALLPSYIERGGSSLVYMFDRLIRATGQPESGFFLDEYDKLKVIVDKLKTRKRKTILLGVSYALLDLAERGVELDDNFVVMETGGMKGRRREMLKEELHDVLKAGFKISAIHAEYGMTELLSQAYSKGEGIFECPPWMKIVIRDADDPLSLAKEGRTGGVNVIDLANQHSCAFIATQDLGRLRPGGSFEIAGRFDNSDIRGCNLMVK